MWVQNTEGEGRIGEEKKAYDSVSSCKPYGGHTIRRLAGTSVGPISSQLYEPA